MLPVPELIPFRLSRQLLEVMAPYRAGGLYTHAMISTLSRTTQPRRKDKHGGSVVVALTWPGVGFFVGFVGFVGLFTQRCRHPVLRRHRDLLLNVMDVFVKDPLQDWRRFALREARRSAAVGAGGRGPRPTLDVAEYARGRLTAVARKLQLVHPARTAWARGDGGP